MSTRGADINADYLQIRNIEIVRGDTVAFSVRLNNNGLPVMLDENGVVTFSIFDRVKQPIIIKRYISASQDENGYIEISLLPSETSILRKADHYTYELEWIINARTIYTILSGQVNVIEDKITAENRGG